MPLLAQLVDDVVVNKIELTPGTLVVGRHPNSDIQIDDATISSRHAQIHIAASEYIEGVIEVAVEDLGSTNGTFVNEESVTATMVDKGDVIRFGNTAVKVTVRVS